MYIILTITSTHLSFQLKTDAGTDIGSADTYDKTTHRLDRKLPSHYLVQFSASEDGTFPPVAAYPIERIIFKS